MLSILIPVYNFDVKPLVKTLVEQCVLAEIPYELILSDDVSEASFQEQYKELNSLENVSVYLQKENLGRSKIRNFLAQKSSGEFLLFLDCDAQITDRSFIQKYWKKRGENSVVCGGTCYQNTPPDEGFTLHWTYGKNREEKSAAQRQSQAYSSFKTFSFLLPEKIYTGIKLDESIKGYGHEDTLFGIKLKEKQIPIVHIDNPLMHKGLVETEQFLSKTKTALFNLAILHTKGEVGKEIKLIRYYLYAKKTLIIPIVLKRFYHQKESILTNLRGNYPSLRKFDFYRLGKFIQYMDEQKDQ